MLAFIGNTFEFLVVRGRIELHIVSFYPNRVEHIITCYNKKVNRLFCLLDGKEEYILVCARRGFSPPRTRCQKQKDGRRPSARRALNLIFAPVGQIASLLDSFKAVIFRASAQKRKRRHALALLAVVSRLLGRATKNKRMVEDHLREGL